MESTDNRPPKISIEEVIKSKNPTLLKVLPGFLIKYIKKIVHQDHVNGFITRHGDKQSYAFVDAIVEEFGIKNGKNHLEIGYLPCRVLKAISYGQLGITDSEKVKGILGDHVIYHENIEELFKIAVQERQNTEKIKQAMIYIQNHHTYVQRARDLIRALLN